MILLALSLSLVTHDMGRTQTAAAKSAATHLAIPKDAEYTYLTGGMTRNRNFHVGNFVFRFLDLSNPFKFRNGELRAHRIGESLGLAPKIHYADEKASLFVIDYLPGKHITKNDLESLKTLARKLKALHTYKGPYPHRYSQHLRAYLHWERGKQIKAHYPDGFAEEVRKLIKYRPVKYVPIHGDVIPSNVIITEDGPYLIDWTNAAYDSPLVDLALLPILLSLPEETEEAYLTAYGSIDPDAFLEAKKRAYLLSALIYYTNGNVREGGYFYGKYRLSARIP